MAAPIYTEAEVKLILASKKFVDYDAWENPSQGRSGKNSTAVTAEIEDWPSALCWIEQERSALLCSLSILVQVPNRPREAVCRYDIQHNGHKNPAGTLPARIKPAEPHRHIYSPGNVKKYGSWSSYAELVDLGPKPHCTLLLHRFVDDMNIQWNDGTTRQMMLEYMR